MSGRFDAPQEDPVEAVRRATRPALRRRFYAKAAVVADADGHAVTLDGKPVWTPARRLLAAPTGALAAALAAEWDAQRDTIDPATMPLTRLANVIIDGVAERAEPVAAEIAQYLQSDLLFYRAVSPRQLIERQRAHWDPILAWAGDALRARFVCTEGVTHIAQPQGALEAARAAIPEDAWRLGALHAATTLTGSALIALALARGFLSVDAAWQAAHVDEDWNLEQWGRDELAMARRASRFAELKAAATVLEHSSID
jgi:chaperone required for assembly of F1-ATPase